MEKENKNGKKSKSLFPSLDLDKYCAECAQHRVSQEECSVQSGSIIYLSDEFAPVKVIFMLLYQLTKYIWSTILPFIKAQIST